MVKPPCPTNFLACREHYQVTRYKLRATEQKLMAAFGVATIADLEMRLTTESGKKGGPHAALMAAYTQQHQDLDSADRTFMAACEIQRRRVADADDAAEQLNRDLAALEC